MTAKIAAQGEIGSTTFSCPQCGKQIITRSGKERAIVAKYSCSECGFVGPN